MYTDFDLIHMSIIELINFARGATQEAAARKKHLSFNQKEKRKRDLGQVCIPFPI